MKCPRLRSVVFSCFHLFSCSIKQPSFLHRLIKIKASGGGWGWDEATILTRHSKEINLLRVEVLPILLLSEGTIHMYKHSPLVSSIEEERISSLKMAI